MAETICSEAANQASAAVAKGDGHVRDFAPLAVVITSYANGQIGFVAKGAETTFISEWKYPALWIKCPTTLSNPDGTPRVNTSGTLYVGTELWTNKLPVAVKQFSQGPKWPENLGFPALDLDGNPVARPQASPMYHELEVSVSSVRIIAHVSDRPGLLTFDLRDSGMPEQTLDLRPVFTTLQVKYQGVDKTESVPMQVLHAHVHGTCLRTQISNTVDLMNPLQADASQAVVFGMSPSKLRLSAVGLGMFGIGFHL